MQTPALTKEEAAKRFGIEPSSLTAEEKEKAQQINHLFDTVYDETGMREAEIFRRVYENEDKASFALRKFLCNVSECPEEVVRFCQEALAPRNRE